jgi:hypothetical protein
MASRARRFWSWVKLSQGIGPGAKTGSGSSAKGAVVVGGAWFGRPHNANEAANDPHFEIKSTHT